MPTSRSFTAPNRVSTGDTRPPRPKHGATTGRWVWLLPLLASCGKPASVEDCEQIVARMTELELRANQVSDPQQIALQVAHTKKSFQERTLKECVGRQLSRGAMACIQRAKTSEEILAECLD